MQLHGPARRAGYPGSGSNHLVDCEPTAGLTDPGAGAVDHREAPAAELRVVLGGDRLPEGRQVHRLVAPVLDEELQDVMPVLPVGIGCGSNRSSAKPRGADGNGRPGSSSTLSWLKRRSMKNPRARSAAAYGSSPTMTPAPTITSPVRRWVACSRTRSSTMSSSACLTCSGWTGSE